MARESAKTTPGRSFYYSDAPSSRSENNLTGTVTATRLRCYPRGDAGGGAARDAEWKRSQNRLLSGRARRARYAVPRQESIRRVFLRNQKGYAARRSRVIARSRTHTRARLSNSKRADSARTATARTLRLRASIEPRRHGRAHSVPHNDSARR